MTTDFSDYPVTLQSVATVSEFRRHLAHYIASVRYGRDRVEIRRDGAEPVYLVSAADFEVLQERLVEIDEGPLEGGRRDAGQTFWARLGQRLTHTAEVAPKATVEPGMPGVVVTRDAAPVPVDWEARRAARRHPHPKDIAEREPPEGSEEALLKARSERLRRVMAEEEARVRAGRAARAEPVEVAGDDEAGLSEEEALERRLERLKHRKI